MKIRTSYKRQYKLTDQSIAKIYLVVMSIQIIPIEGSVVSWLKCTLMAISPFLILKLSPYMTKALKWGLIYIFFLSISVCINHEDFRFGSFFYRVGGVFSFILYYNLIVKNQSLAYNDFFNIVRCIILAYGITIVIQQIANVLVFHNNGFSWLNMIKVRDRGILCANSLSLEPSHSARILAALFITIVRLVQLKVHTIKKSLNFLWYKERWVTIAFLWSMLTMDSGTAFILLPVICLLFVRRKYILLSLPFLILIIFIVTQTIDLTPINRAVAAAESITTGDMQEVYKADMSASARIVPFLYTYQNFDITNFQHLFGQGIDSAKNKDIWGVFIFIGEIDDYGFIPYFFSLILFFKCCIRRIFSVETLFFIVALMMELGNIYYVWLTCMLFATVKYYYAIGVYNKKIKVNKHERDLFSGTKTHSVRNLEVCSSVL